MFKRLLPIFFFTGLAHVTTLVAVKVLSSKVSPQVISEVGEIDSLIFLLLNVLSFGLQLKAVRDIANAEDWRIQYQNTQTSRVTLGIILSIIAIMAYYRNSLLYFIIAPILALNGDYALYAISRPIIGAAVAFIRVLFPAVSLIVSAYYFPALAHYVYLFSCIIVYIITNSIISRKLDQPLFYRPSIHSLSLYIKSIPLGVISINWYFLGLGILLIAPIFYPAQAIATGYLGLKIYIIFKGVIRVLNQAYIREMRYDAACLKIDKLGMTAGVAFAGMCFLFPLQIKEIFFSIDAPVSPAFISLLSISACVTSFSNSLTTRALLDNKDRALVFLTSLAAGVMLLSLVILSATSRSEESIAISLLAGESVHAVGLCLLYPSSFLKKRLYFLIISISMLLPALLLKVFMHPNLYTLFGSLAIFGSLSLIISWKTLFKTQKH